MKTWITDLLKKIIGNGFLLLLIIAVFYILYLRECKRPEPCPAKDEMIIPKSTWDSIKLLANKPPEIRVDTEWITLPAVIPPDTPLPEPKPQSGDSTVNNYADSVVNKEIQVYYSYSVKGQLLDRKWKYYPIIREVNVDSLIYIPYPVDVPKPYPVTTRGLFAYGIAGGNNSAFLFGGGVDFITKKDTELGYLYQRFGNQNFHSVKFGGKIKFGK